MLLFLEANIFYMWQVILLYLRQFLKVDLIKGLILYVTSRLDLFVIFNNKNLLLLFLIVLLFLRYARLNAKFY